MSRYIIYVQDYVPGGEGQKQMVIFRHDIEWEDLGMRVRDALDVSDRIEIMKENDDA
jgi:hypothetical protein